LFLLKREQVHSHGLCMKSVGFSNQKKSETMKIGPVKPRFQLLCEEMKAMRFQIGRNTGFCDHPLCIGLHT